MHNVAVGHKNAIKSLFGFGVTCKIDSSVGKQTNNQCNTHNVKLDTLLFFLPPKSNLPSKEASIWLPPSTRTQLVCVCLVGFVFSSSPYMTVPISDLTPTGQKYFTSTPSLRLEAIWSLSYPQPTFSINLFCAVTALAALCALTTWPWKWKSFTHL